MDAKLDQEPLLLKMDNKGLDDDIELQPVGDTNGDSEPDDDEKDLIQRVMSKKSSDESIDDEDDDYNDDDDDDDDDIDDRELIDEDVFYEEQLFPLHTAAKKGLADHVTELLSQKGMKYSYNDEGYNPLHVAGKFGKWKVVKVLIDSGAVIDPPGIKDGMTPLQLAVRSGKINSVRSFIELGANVLAKNKKGQTCLHIAAGKGFYEILAYLFSLDDMKDQIDITDNEQKTPLHHAVTSGDLETTRLLIDLNSNVNLADGNGNAPLHIAATDDYPELIDLLLQSGDANMKQVRKSCEGEESKGFTPLEIACLHGNVQCARVLMEKGNVKTVSCKNQNKMVVDLKLMYPFHRACETGDINVVYYFVERKACINMKDNNGYTPLMIATWNSHDAIVEYLLQNGAAMHSRDWEHKTCLHVAVEKRDVEILEILLKYSDRYLINCGDRDHRTPLHYAAHRGYKKILELLLKFASYIGTDNLGISPLHLAAERGRLECVKLLLDFSKRSGYSMLDVVNREATDIERSTPISIAANNGHSDVCCHLIKMGGSIEHLSSAETLVFVETLEKLIDTSPTTSKYHEVKPEIECLRCLVLQGEDDVGELSRLMSSTVGIRPGFTISGDGSSTLPKSGRGDINDLKWRSRSIRCLRGEVFAVLNNPGVKRVNKLVDALKRNMEHEYGESEKVFMGKLIKHAPFVAEYALNKSIETLDGDNMRINFELLDIPHLESITKIKEPFFAPDTMNRYGRKSLLSHPATKRLLKSKWERLCLGAFILGLFLYIIYLGLITTLVVIDKDRMLNHINSTSKSFYGTTTSHDAHFIVSWILLIFCISLSIKELLRMRYFKLLYIQQPSNFFEFVTYIVTIVFVIPFTMEVGIESDALATVTRFKWEAGAFSILFAWITLLLYLKWIPSIGLYVWMFEEVTKTVIKVVLGLICLVFAFGFSLYILLSSKVKFQEIDSSFMQVILWTFGEFNYDGTFIQLQYKEITFIVFVAFLIVMPILTMNLLVGLAVGNIDDVKKTASDRNQTNQVRALDNFNETFPKWILRKLYKKEEIYNPNSSSMLESMKDWSVDIDNDDIENQLKERSQTITGRNRKKSEWNNDCVDGSPDVPLYPHFQPVFATIA